MARCNFQALAPLISPPMAASISSCLSSFDPTLRLRPRHHEHENRRNPRRSLPSGRSAFANGSLSYATLPSGLSELNGSPCSLRDRVHIETLTARTGGRTLAFRVDATYSISSSISISRPTAKTFACVIPRRSSTASADCTGGNAFRSTVSGEITSANRRYPGFDFKFLTSTWPSGFRPSPSPISTQQHQNSISTSRRRPNPMRDRHRAPSATPISVSAASVARPACSRPGRYSRRSGHSTARATSRSRRHQFHQSGFHRTATQSRGLTQVRNYDLNITIYRYARPWIEHQLPF